MPVAAAAFLQRIADFLAVGATPQASTEAGDGFSAQLAAIRTDETGKTLPLDRQDLAAPTIELPTTDLDPQGAAPAAGTAPLTIASADALPSTAAILIATDSLPKAAVVMTAPEPQEGPAQDDGIAPQLSAKTEASAPAIHQAVTPPIVDRLIADLPIAQQPTTDATLPTQTATVAPLQPAKTPNPTSHATPQAQLPVSPSSDATSDPATVTDAVSTSVALPQADVLSQTTDPLPIASPVAIAPAVTIETPASIAAVPIAAETADTVATAEITLPSPQLDAKSPRPQAEHHVGRSAKAGSQPTDDKGSTPASEATFADTAPVVERLAAMSLPAATISINTPASPFAIPAQPVADVVQPASIAPTVTAPLPLPIAAEIATPPMRTDALPATPVETAPTAAVRTAVEQSPAPPTGNMTAAVQPAVTAPATTGVSFVARATRPLANQEPVPQPAQMTIAATKAEVVAPVAANPAVAPEREALPFHTTARQILATQPTAADAVRVPEIETTVRPAVTDATPTIAQHLAPVGQGSERIIATAVPVPVTALSTEQAAALIETIQMLRSEAKSDAMTLAVDHDDLGKITMRFDRTDHGVAVRIDSADPSVNQLIANSAPALRASGDSVGMRFDRQDAQGSSAGTSRDAPRQGAGQERNPTPYAQSSRPRASGQRDGLFA